MDKKISKNIIKLLIGILVVAGIWWLVKCQCVNLKALTPAAIRDYIQSFGRLAALVYVVAYALNTISIVPPIAPLSLTAGLAFGAARGALYLMAAAMIGTSITFMIGRFFGRSLVDRLLKGKFRDLDEKLERNGFMTILFFRVIPLVPYEVLNYASGLSKIKFKDYFFATFLGLIPGVVIAAFFGGSLGEIKSVRDIASPKFLTAIGLMALIIAVPAIYQMIKKKSKKAMSIALPICASLLLLFPGRSEAGGIKYNTYDILLKSYVEEGEVDYLAWKKYSFHVFERYIKGLGAVSLEGLSSDERKAFWINAYNALTIYAVLQYIPSKETLAKVFSVQMVPGFFDDKEYFIAGEPLTLNDIENVKLREGFGDARVHFTIVCASGSCPRIDKDIYTAKGLGKRLEDKARLFIQDETRNRLDRENNILHLSQIFKWYERDFINDSGSVINYIKKYLSRADAVYLSGREVQIDHLYYDWLVNIKRR